MNTQDIQRSLKSLRLSAMADTLDTRILQAQTETLAPGDFLALLIDDELTKRGDRLVQRRVKTARFRDRDKTIDTFDFEFNKKMNSKTVFELASCKFIGKREDALFLGPPGTGKSHIAQALGMAAILQNYRVLYRETHALLEEIADATLDGQRKAFLQSIDKADLLIIDDLGMRRLPKNAAEDLLELIMRRYERHSTIMTSNRPVEDWGKLLGDTAAVGALLDRLLHHGHVLRFGPNSWRMRRKENTEVLPTSPADG